MLLFTGHWKDFGVEGALWLERIWWRENLPTLPKHIFPTLLSRVMTMVCETVEENLISDFRKCGIFLTDKVPLLQRFASICRPGWKLWVSHWAFLCKKVFVNFRLKERWSKVDITLIGDSFLEVMDKKLGNTSGVTNTRRKKLNVPPGKGITPDDLDLESENVPVPVLSLIHISEPTRPY